MNLNEESQKIFQELQVLEHNINSLLTQKQSFQLELNETINALEETKKTSGDIYKIVGSIMLKADKEKTIKDLEEKKKILNLRNDSIEKQENLFEKKAKDLQDKLKKEMSSLKQEESKK